MGIVCTKFAFREAFVYSNKKKMKKKKWKNYFAFGQMSVARPTSAGCHLVPSM